MCASVSSIPAAASVRSVPHAGRRCGSSQRGFLNIEAFPLASWMRARWLLLLCMSGLDLAQPGQPAQKICRVMRRIPKDLRLIPMWQTPNNHMQRSVLDKVHAPDCRAAVGISGYAPQVRRAAADVGR
jgi:hypothetical protein